MRLVFALVLAALGIVTLAPRRAAASGCYLGPFAPSADIPVGCPVFHWQQGMFEEPRVYARRGGQFVELAATIETDAVELEVAYVQTDCEGVDHVTQQREPYEHARITFGDALVGDELWIEKLPIGMVVASGACPADVTPSPVCGAALPSCEDAQRTNQGCNAGGGGGLAIGLFAIVLGLRRRRTCDAHERQLVCLACPSP